jgi:hypothetical protein
MGFRIAGCAVFVILFDGALAVQAGSFVWRSNTAGC